MSAPLQLLRRLADCTSGAALVEATLAMPVVIALMMGATDFGRAYSTSSTADKSMRDAARYLAHLPASAVCGWGLTNAQNLAVYGNIAGSGSPLISGWSTANVTLTQPASCASNPTIIQLSATVPFTSIMLAGMPTTLSTQHEERWIGG